MGVVVRRYIDFLIILISTPLVFPLFGSSIPTFFSFFFSMFFVLVPVHFCNLLKKFPRIINKHKGDYRRPTEAV